MTLTANRMFNFTPPTNGRNMKNINEFAATKAACSLVLYAAFLVTFLSSLKRGAPTQD